MSTTPPPARIRVCILAGFSVSSLQATTAIPSLYARILSICIIGALLVVPTGAILRATQTPDVRIPFEIAVYMNSHLQQSDRALVLAKLWEGSPDAVPNEYTRIATQTQSGSERILPPNEFRSATNPDSIIKTRDIRYLIEFSHFEEQGYLKEFKEYILNSTGMVREVASWDHVRVLEVVSGGSR